MKAFTQWNFHRYRPAVHGTDDIYVTRVIPHRYGFELFHDGGEGCALRWRRAFTEDGFEKAAASCGKAEVSGLAEDTEYEFFLEKSSSSRSAHGFVHTGYAPGFTVNYLSKNDPKYSFSGNYLCTPCLLCHSDGYMLASMDIYAPKGGQNLTLIFRSDDGGETWRHITELFPCFWGTLFEHEGAVYMLGTSTEYGDLLIGRSDDGGFGWTVPSVLQRGSCNCSLPGWHKSSGHVTEHGGRLWCAVDYGCHAQGGHASAMISAPADSDLLDPLSWSITEPLRYDPSWPGACKGDDRGFIEGNAVVGKDGSLFNILRYSMSRGSPDRGLAGVLRADLSDPEATLSFERFMSFPGNHSKFDILYDEQSGRYWSVVSRLRETAQPGDRNLLSLIWSENLLSWHTAKDLIDYTSRDPKMHGFQYVSFTICGDDIRFLCRTATNDAHSYHDSNYITYHCVKNFRSPDATCDTPEKPI